MNADSPVRSARKTFLNCVLAVSIFIALAEYANAQNSCDLVTPAELQSALGTAVTMKPAGGPQICMGQAPGYRVMLRLAKTSDASGAKEAKGIAMAKQMGAQVDVRKFGDTTCSTFIPPANMAQAGYNTTCSAFKNGQVGAVEVTATSQQDMVSIEKLRPLADKIGGKL